ncbi:MAG: response regulator [bacterium]
MSMAEIKVLMIDDHTLFRLGLEGLLRRRAISVVGSVGDGRRGVRMAKQLQPDIVLLDMRMPEMSGVSVLRELRKEGLTMPIVMLTTSQDERDLVESLRSGAQGYLLKDMDPDALVSALRDILRGKTIVSPDLAPTLARVVQDDGAISPMPSPFENLTPRELEILSLLAEGQSNKVIARNLGISDGTVKLHVKAILRKLDVHSRVEAAVIAVEHGLRANRSDT